MLINSKYELKNMEHYDVFIKYPLNCVLREVVAGLNPEITDQHILLKLSFVYNKYNYFENNLAHLISSKEGGGCSIDKSRWIIQRYRDYIVEGTIPDMTIEEKCYWKPAFGTGEQWMLFCKGLAELYCGNPKEYLIAFMALNL